MPKFRSSAKLVHTPIHEHAQKLSGASRCTLCQLLLSRVILETYSRIMHTDECVQVVQSTMLEQAEDDAIMPARVAAKEIAFGSVSAVFLLL